MSLLRIFGSDSAASDVVVFVFVFSVDALSKREKFASESKGEEMQNKHPCSYFRKQCQYSQRFYRMHDVAAQLRFAVRHILSHLHFFLINTHFFGAEAHCV